jgi:hypothetical protein
VPVSGQVFDWFPALGRHFDPFSKKCWPKGYLATLALPPFITRSTSASVAIVVSPGVVIARAP